MRQFIIAILLVYFCNLSLHGQQCKAHIYYERHISKTEHLEDLRKSRLALLKSTIKANNNANKRNTLVTLPLVFHVLYNTTPQNIDSLQIASQIDVLNQDFRKLNGNLNILQGGFTNLAADAEIAFQLATTDPDGNPTNGITKTFTSNPALGGNDSDYYDPAKGGVPAWDPKHYINIWVLNINAAGGDFGFASFPGEANPISSDGVVVDYKYLGTTGTAANSSPQHLGRTLTHELGHYFGLFHIWGDVDDCSDDDDIADTPLQETSTDGCLNYPAFDLCTATGDGINFYNYMDYTDDECMAMFTVDQVARIRAILSLPFDNGGRSELIELYSSQKEVTYRTLNLYPNPTSNSVQIEIDDKLPNVGHINLYDIAGTLVIRTRITANRKLDLSALQEGIYILSIQGDNTIWSQKIVVTR